ncbi:MAG: hypothetical protein ISS15_19770 [Alphaproteobacteria bacterium]|nr:hypothetical protein [Alphaproteobacteria bacterium]MBL7099902.1 hypothetical protein [Alphaproteobacteria bacterium]
MTVLPGALRKARMLERAQASKRQVMKSARFSAVCLSKRRARQDFAEPAREMAASVGVNQPS